MPDAPCVPLPSVCARQQAAADAQGAERQQVRVVHPGDQGPRAPVDRPRQVARGVAAVVVLHHARLPRRVGGAATGHTMNGLGEGPGQWLGRGARVAERTACA